MIAPRFTKAGQNSSSSPSSPSSIARRKTPAEEAAFLEQLKNDWSSFYVLSTIACGFGLFVTNMVNFEPVYDDTGKPMKDKDGKTITKLTTLGITLTVIFSIILVIVYGFMIWRNRDKFLKMIQKS
jgi:hypothetical protein